ncbi:MAG TPA: hypothetical protein DCE44_19790, partial [Verrucomicrobiales bacterium]|nr:hypothetical protein [Verrucomicrobiales bacterium]
PSTTVFRSRERFGKAAMARVVAADDALDPVADPGGVEALAFGEDELRDVAPILLAVEDGLEDDEILGGEDVDRLARPEGEGAAALHAGVVERVVREEEVDRRPAPMDPRLAVARQARPLAGARGVGTEADQRGEDFVGAARFDEDVDVDVDRRARGRVVGEGDGAAEGMGDARLPQRGFDEQDLLRERRLGVL